MSRRLPMCAHCGVPLRGRTIRLSYQIPGRPEVGWHYEPCWDADPVAVRLVERRDDPAADADAELRDLLMTIHERGEGRLVANKEWWR